MLGSILIGLDTPKHAAVLTELGLCLAQKSDVTLVGLGIVDEPGIRAIEPAFPVGGTPGVDPVIYMGYEARVAQLERDIDQLLQQFAGRCATAGAKHEEVRVAGAPDVVIEAESQSCDLIMLARGSRFRFTARDNEPDETYKKVLKNATRPLVVVPATAAPDGPTVIAYDGSLQAARALAAFQATGLAESGQVHLVCVDSSAVSASRHVARARQFLARHKIEAVPHLVEPSAPPATLILQQVRSLGAGLLVMGAYGQPALREFFIGSVTRTLLAESPVPLFVYH